MLLNNVLLPLTEQLMWLNKLSVHFTVTHPDMLNRARCLDRLSDDSWKRACHSLHPNAKTRAETLVQIGTQLLKGVELTHPITKASRREKCSLCKNWFKMFIVGV